LVERLERRIGNISTGRVETFKEEIDVLIL